MESTGIGVGTEIGTTITDAIDFDLRELTDTDGFTPNGHSGEDASVKSRNRSWKVGYLIIRDFNRCDKSRIDSHNSGGTHG